MSLNKTDQSTQDIKEDKKDGNKKIKISIKIKSNNDITSDIKSNEGNNKEMKNEKESKPKPIKRRETRKQYEEKCGVYEHLFIDGVHQDDTCKNYFCHRDRKRQMHNSASTERRKKAKINESENTCQCDTFKSIRENMVRIIEDAATILKHAKFDTKEDKTEARKIISKCNMIVLVEKGSAKSDEIK